VNPDAVTSQRLSRLALLVFPLVLWLVSTGALFAWDLGKYSDDWAVSLRVPETDAYAWPNAPWERWNYFWRPLHLVTVYGLATMFWHHDWVNHLISALAHLGVAALLWRLLRTLGVSPAGTSAAVSVFITFPIAYEAVLWPAAIGSVVSVGWFLLIALMCVRLSRIERLLTRAESLRWFGALAAMTFLCASWHEQGAACVAALPALMLAARSVVQTARVAIRRITLVLAACAVGCMAYIALLMATAPRGKRGSAESIVDIGDAGARAGNVLRQVMDWLAGEKLEIALRDMGITGVYSLISSAWGWAALTALTIVFCFWAIKCVPWLRKNDRREAETRAAVGWWLRAFSVIVCIASLLPIALVRQNFVFGRYFYPTGIGLAAALASFDVLLRSRGASSSVRGMDRLLHFFCGMAGFFFAVSGVGWQVTYREAFRKDLHLGEQLRAALPKPESGTVFVPIDLHLPPRADPDGFPRTSVPGALWQPWSSWGFIQRTYGRSDLTATHWRPGARAPITLDERGVTYPRGLADSKGRIVEAPSHIPRERAIVFTVDAAGTVRVLEWDEARRMASAP
jgi:hypothetical protein